MTKDKKRAVISLMMKRWQDVVVYENKEILADAGFTDADFAWLKKNSVLKLESQW